MTKLVNKDAERLNPCLKEQEQSYACLSRNGYDNAKCEKYFDNYNTCKKFWPVWWALTHWSLDGSVQKERRAKGLYPYLPEIEDREKIKGDFFKKVQDNV